MNKMENIYVIKVTRFKQGRGWVPVPWFARTKESTKPFNWAVIKGRVRVKGKLVRLTCMVIGQQ
jgi:hypothetical protein